MHNKRKNGSRDTLSSLTVEDGKLASHESHTFCKVAVPDPQEPRELLSEQAEKNVYV